MNADHKINCNYVRNKIMKRESERDKERHRETQRDTERHRERD